MSRLIPPVGKGDHIWGAESAPVVLVEYGDFECDNCGEAYPIVKMIQKKLGKELMFVFRNFPLSGSHSHALQAALCAEAAGYQNKFWKMHDLLFEHQNALEEEDLIIYAESLKLDIHRFIHDSGSEEASQKVHEDFISGVKSGVNGTPTFFINGKRHNGLYDYKNLLSAIEERRSNLIHYGR